MKIEFYISFPNNFALILNGLELNSFFLEKFQNNNLYK